MLYFQSLMKVQLKYCCSFKQKGIWTQEERLLDEEDTPFLRICDLI